MTIAAEVVGEEGEDAVDFVTLVAEFVADCQRASAVAGADADGEDDPAPEGQTLRADPIGDREIAQPVNRHSRPGEPRVIGIDLHRGDDFGRRIVKILTEPGVHNRNDAEDEGEGDQCRQSRFAGEKIEPERHHWDRRKDRRQSPQIALSVSIDDFVSARVDSGKGHVFLPLSDIRQMNGGWLVSWPARAALAIYSRFIALIYYSFTLCIQLKAGQRDHCPVKGTKRSICGFDVLPV
jgi:hypothetical protein